MSLVPANHLQCMCLRGGRSLGRNHPSHGPGQRGECGFTMRQVGTRKLHREGSQGLWPPRGNGQRIPHISMLGHCTHLPLPLSAERCTVWPSQAPHATCSRAVKTSEVSATESSAWRENVTLAWLAVTTLFDLTATVWENCVE